MTEQRERAKADARVRKAGLTPATVYREVMDSAGVTDFTGYTEVVSEGVLRGLLVDGESVPAAGPGEHVEASWTAPRSTPRAAARSATRA